MGSTPPGSRLYAPLEGPISTLYAELAERARTERQLLPGTPGMLALRERPGFGLYWYRRYYDAPGTPQIEDFVCSANDVAEREAMLQRIAAAAWGVEQVRNLRHFGMQVANKDVARVLIEFHNRGFFSTGLVMVGTLAFMSWLNEFGVRAAVSHTQDIDLARRERLSLAAPVSFMEVIEATRLDFSAVPGFDPADRPTSVKRSGREGLRVDFLTPGVELGRVVRIPELDWHAQAVPYFGYLLASPRRVAMLAGGHCIPVSAPAPERLAWHKLYSSTRRLHDTAKAEKDLRQAATLMAVLVERDNLDLARSAAELPPAISSAARRRLPALRRLLVPHPQALDEMELALSLP